MANWTDLKAAMADIVKTNGNNEITGALMQNVLSSIIDGLGGNASYKGVALPNTVPGSPDGNEFYLATQVGTYVNFGGYVHSGLSTILFSNITGSWAATDLGIPTNSRIVQIESDSEKIKTETDRNYSALFPVSSNGKYNVANGALYNCLPYRDKATSNMDWSYYNTNRVGLSLASGVTFSGAANLGVIFSSPTKTWKPYVRILFKNTGDTIIPNAIQFLAVGAIDQFDAPLGGKNNGLSYVLIDNENKIYEVIYNPDDAITTAGDAVYIFLAFRSEVTATQEAGVYVLDYLIEDRTDAEETITNPVTKGIFKILNQFSPAETVNEVIVSADESSTYEFKGKNAIQQAIDSIIDASENNRYRIYVLNGLYKITNSSEFIGGSGYPSMICMKDYVDIVGQSKDGVIIWAELPYADASIDTATDRILHQTVWNYAKDVTMKNMTLVAKNIRYVIHQDDDRSANSKRYYKNVDLVFIGDKGGLNAWGLGSWDGEENYVENGKCQASYMPFSCHNNTNFSKPTKWSFINYQFATIHALGVACICLNSGSLVKDELHLNGCSWGGRSYKISYTDGPWLKGGQYSSFDHAEFRILGSGNAPFLFDNNVGGQSLRVKSKSTGANSKIRFKTSSTAFEALIKNPRDFNGVNISNPGISVQDNYLICDGSVDLSGWALGCRDLSGIQYMYESAVLDSLGKNLGNCSVTPKTLIIEIDGVEFTITFNSDYTDVNNADILAIINGVIGAVATADLYAYGLLYYPEMPDVMTRAINESTTVPILKGTVVQKTSNGYIEPCTDDRNVFGVALDDIPVRSTDAEGAVLGWGRVMVRGYIESNDAKAFNIRTNDAIVIGGKYAVDNGVLSLNASGSIIPFADGIVKINC